MEENKKNNYRITFHDGPNSSRSKCVDVYAKDSDEAFDLAYKMPEARRRLYDNILIEKIPTGPSIIGVEYEYYDRAAERNFTDRFFIKAENEKQAIDYYNKHYKGNRYGTYYDKNKKTDRFIRGKVLNTYFAVAINFDADATVPVKKETLEEKISHAKSKEEKSKTDCKTRNNKERE